MRKQTIYSFTIVAISYAFFLFRYGANLTSCIDALKLTVVVHGAGQGHCHGSLCLPQSHKKNSTEFTSIIPAESHHKHTMNRFKKYTKSRDIVFFQQGQKAVKQYASTALTSTTKIND